VPAPNGETRREVSAHWRRIGRLLEWVLRRLEGVNQTVAAYSVGGGAIEIARPPVRLTLNAPRGIGAMTAQLAQ
jgi:hypothetical protein